MVYINFSKLLQVSKQGITKRPFNRINFIDITSYTELPCYDLAKFLKKYL